MSISILVEKYDQNMLCE